MVCKSHIVARTIINRILQITACFFQICSKTKRFYCPHVAGCFGTQHAPPLSFICLQMTLSFFLKRFDWGAAVGSVRAAQKLTGQNETLTGLKKTRCLRGVASPQGQQLRRSAHSVTWNGTIFNVLSCA